VDKKAKLAPPELFRSGYWREVTARILANSLAGFTTGPAGPGKVLQAFAGKLVCELLAELSRVAVRKDIAARVAGNLQSKPRQQKGKVLNVNGSSAKPAMNAASDLLHAPVMTGSGESVGHVEDILLNTFSGKLEFLTVRPRVQEGSVCVRLSWNDVKVDADGERVILIPGRTAAKRLLIRICGPDRTRPALH
jgi:sporulation protein YlmC with PRC-barrel domain